MSNVKVTLAIGIALTIAVGAFTLTHSPPRVVRINESRAIGSLGVTQSELAICQGNETLPAGVTAIRFSIVAFFGSNLQVVAYHNGRIVTEGSRGPDWSGTSATVPVKALNHATSHVNLCVAFTPNTQLLQLFGRPASARNTGVVFQSKKRLTATLPRTTLASLHGRLLVTYLASGRGSWWSRVATVATHMGLGHFISGKWVALLAAILMAAVSILTVRLTLREQP
jgi:hypothetical protein